MSKKRKTYLEAKIKTHGRTYWRYVLGGIAAFSVIFPLVTYTIKGQKSGDEYCHLHYDANRSELNYCLAQNSQGPGWAIGFGIWFVTGAFLAGHFVGNLIDKRYDKFD